ncbi:MAG: LptF/LptG family permease [Phycisphaerae bacterium]
MRTLDRYVVRSFLSTALVTALILLLLRAVIDLFLNMDEFTESGEGIWAVAQDILFYYGWQMLIYITELGGITIVIAATFTLARMNHTNELTAMLASGVSLRRVVLPIIIFSLIMGGIIVVDQEILIPRNREKLLVDRDDVDLVDSFGIAMLKDENSGVWSAKQYLPSQHQMRNVMLAIRDRRIDKEIGGEVAKPVAVIAAKSATNRGVGPNMPQPGWWLSNASIRRIEPGMQPWAHLPTTERVYAGLNPDKIIENSGRGYDFRGKIVSIDQNDEAYRFDLKAKSLHPGPVPGPNQQRSGTLIAPRFELLDAEGEVFATLVADSASWVFSRGTPGFWKLTNGRIFYPTRMNTQQIVLRRSRRWTSYVSSKRLGEMLEMEDLPNRETVEMTRYTRFVDPLTNLLALLIGLPFVLSRERNIKASAAMCLTTVVLFYGFVYASRYAGLDPFWAAVAPVVVGGPLVAVMFDSIRT